MPAPDKQLILQRFRRGLDSYTGAAEMQQLMAVRLMELLLPFCPPDRFFRHILELGAGTGILTGQTDRLLRWDRRVVNDLVPECRRFHEQRSRTEFRPGDAESIRWEEGSFELVLSNAAVQWFADLPAFFRNLRRAMADRGILAFTTFGPENMRELRELAVPSLSYRTLEDTAALLRQAGFDILKSEDKQLQLSFASPQEILRHCRQTGVAACAVPASPWTRRQLEDFCNEYRRRFSSQDGGVVLSWHPIYIIAKGI